MVHPFAWSNIECIQKTHCTVYTALSSADSWTHAKPTWMLLWIIILLLLLCWTNKDFILFIPLNVFNDIALRFDIFIQLRANQRLATEYLLKERLDSIAFAISIDRITLLIWGQNATLCCLLLLKLKVPNIIAQLLFVVVLSLDLIYWHQINGTAINVFCRQGLYRYNYTISSLCS